MDFVHCNSCFAAPDPSSTRLFYLSSCGHIFCQNCGGPSNGQCRVCSKKCNFIELNGQLKPDIQRLFADLPQVAKKLQHEVKSFAQAVDFQKTHRARYVNFLQQQLKKARHVQETANSELRRRQQCENELISLKEQVAQLQKQLSTRFQTPGITPAPIRRHRSNRLMPSNAMDSGLTPRSNFTVDSEGSLPAGVSASTFGGSPESNFVQGDIFSRSPMTLEPAGLPAFSNKPVLPPVRNTTMQEQARLSFRDVWGSNFSEITLDSCDRTPHRRGMHHPLVGAHNLHNANGIAAGLGRRR